MKDVKEFMFKLILKFNHSLITIPIVLVFSLFGYGYLAAIACTWFWIGREYTQAEYRYMENHKTNRNKSPWYMGFLSESWNIDSFIVDMLIPSVIAFITVLVVSLF